MEKLIQTAIIAAIEAGKAIIEIYNTGFDIELKEDNSPLTTADKKAHKIISEYLIDTGIPILSEEGKHLAHEERKQWHQFWLVDPLDGTKEFIKKNGEFTVNIAFIEDGKTVAGVIYVPVTDILYVGLKDEGAFKLDDTFGFDGSVEQLIKTAVKLPENKADDEYIVVASRSHLNSETALFLEKIKKSHPNIKIVSKGSSLKLCLVAEGKADVYPRFAPTMEWDTGAGQCIVEQAGGAVLHLSEKKPLYYNKKDLSNPDFICVGKHSRHLDHPHYTSEGHKW